VKPQAKAEVKSAAKGAGAAPSLSDTLDTTSGASTADTATPLPESMLSSGDMSSLAGCQSPSTEASASALSKGVDGKKKAAGTRVSLDQQCLQDKAADPGNFSSWSKGNCTASHERLHERMSLPGDKLEGDNSRDVLNFLYVKAEQSWLWKQMQRRASVAAHEVPSANLSGAAMPEQSLAPKAVVTDKRIVRHSIDKRMLDDFDLGAIDENSLSESSEAKARQTSKEASASAKSKAETVVRRQSCFILSVDGGEDDEERRKSRDDITAGTDLSQVAQLAKGSAGNASSPKSVAIAAALSDAGSAGTGATASATDAKASKNAAGPSAAAPCPNTKSPLKQLICVKKVDLDQVRALITRLPDAHMWIDTILDPGPPLVPRPVVYAVAQNDPGLVELLVELDADVTKPYDGPTMYKGWIKPGTCLLQCVQNRKGRFVGTMLADRLTQIETILHRALHEQALKAGKDEPEEEEEHHEEEDAPVQEVVGTDGNRRKSVAIKTDLGVMRHTQGHPSDIYEILEHLGDGDTSSCWEGWHRDTKVPCAIKAEMKSDEAWLWEEINIMRRVDHPNIVKLFETFENDSQVFMVLELCEGGRLFDKVVAVEHCNFRCARLAGHLASAINYLHGKNICHRDIQLDNFLLLDDRPLEEAVVKLIDFTTAKAFGPNEPPMKTKICTPGYVAKEILTRKEVPYTEKVDIWSLGVTFFIMLCGSPPFYGDTDFEILKKVKKGTFKFEPEHVWANVPDKARDLVNRMICKAEDRLSAAGVLEHPWISLPS